MQHSTELTLCSVPNTMLLLKFLHHSDKPKQYYTHFSVHNGTMKPLLLITIARPAELGCTEVFDRVAVRNGLVCMEYTQAARELMWKMNLHYILPQSAPLCIRMWLLKQVSSATKPIACCNTSDICEHHKFALLHCSTFSLSMSFLPPFPPIWVLMWKMKSEMVMYDISGFLY